MPPIAKCTAEQILDAAFELVRSEGASALNARSLAAALGVSTQPIFSHFRNMPMLRLALEERIVSFYQNFLDQGKRKGDFPAYKGEGMAYIDFARQEPKLFSMMFLSPREGIPQEDAYYRETVKELSEQSGLEESAAGRMHLEMWLFVHGIASMQATGRMTIPQETVSAMLTDVYLALLEKFREEA